MSRVNRPSKQNLLFDGSLGNNRFVCSSCKVPFAPGERKILTGWEEGGLERRRIFICCDCQRQTVWVDDLGVDDFGFGLSDVWP